MDGDEGRIGDEVAVGGEEGAGEVEALLDVRADRRLLQRPAHRLRDAHEPVSKERQQDRVCLLVAGHGGW